MVWIVDIKLMMFWYGEASLSLKLFNFCLTSQVLLLYVFTIKFENILLFFVLFESTIIKIFGFNFMHQTISARNNSDINTLLKSNMHIPTYAGLLSFNVTLLLRIATKLFSNIFCDI